MRYSRQSLHCLCEAILAFLPQVTDYYIPHQGDETYYQLQFTEWLVRIFFTDFLHIQFCPLHTHISLQDLSLPYMLSWVEQALIGQVLGVCIQVSCVSVHRISLQVWSSSLPYIASFFRPYMVAGQAPPKHQHCFALAILSAHQTPTMPNG